jgi:PAS domain S-box-containing protein
MVVAIAPIPSTFAQTYRDLLQAVLATADPPLAPTRKHAGSRLNPRTTLTLADWIAQVRDRHSFTIPEFVTFHHQVLEDLSATHPLAPAHIAQAGQFLAQGISLLSHPSRAKGATENTALLQAENTALKQRFRDRTHELQRTVDCLRHSERRYRQIVETATEGIWIVDRNDRTTFVNDQMATMLGYTCAELMSYRPTDLINLAASPHLESCFTRHQSGELVRDKVEVEYRRKDGSPLWAIASCSALYDETGAFNGVLATVTDISDRKRFEAALEHLVAGTAACTGNNFFAAMTENLSRVLGVNYVMMTRREDNNLHTLVFWADGQSQPNVTISYPGSACEQTFRHGSYLCADRLLDQFPDSQALAQLQAQAYCGVALTNMSGEPIGTLCVLDRRPLVDAERCDQILRIFAARVSAELERNRVATALQVSESRFQNLATNVPGMLYRFIQDASGAQRMEYVSPACRDLWEVDPEAAIADGGELLLQLVHPDDAVSLANSIALSAASLNTWRWEGRIVTPTGRVKWIQGIAKPDGAADDSIIWDGITIDITERKQAQNQLRASLHEKDLLLKEIHHRVKNNLQVVGSLLWLQANTIQDPNIRQLFEESQNRLYSMALIHEQLYRSSNLSEIDFGDYLRDLVENLIESYSDHRDRLETIVQVESIAVNVETASACGLLVTELVSNALKYAFPEGRSGQLAIHCHRDMDQQFWLTVQDNGVGLPSDLEQRKAKSLGLQLVDRLAQQLNATIHISTSPGTCFQFRFQELPYNQRF